MSKGGGSSTVTNVQTLPPEIAAALSEAYGQFNPFTNAFGAVADFDPKATKTKTAGLTALENAAIKAAQADLNKTPAYLSAAQQNLGDLMGGAIDSSALQEQYGLGAVDNTLLANAAQAQTDVSPLSSLIGQQNAATNVLADMTTQDTNPFLAQQIENAIGGAVDKVSSQYALGGRLGSDSFAGALGAGIAGAAAPILSQNLQQDRANQLAAAQALGQVSGQENQQQINLANSLLGAQQTDLSRQLQGAGALTDLEMDQRQLGANLANQLTSASEADTRARLAAASAAPSLLAADQSIINQAAQLGGLQRGITQAGYDAAAAQANQQNVLDQNRINALLSASGMGSGMFGTTTTQSGGGPSAIQSGLGGAIAGAGLANTLGIAGLSPALGAGIGGGLGLLGLLSDRRLKQNIKKVGTHANGLAVYSWDWNPEAKDRGFDIYPTEGFMAQEAKEVYPQHVYTHPSGFLMLDYASLNNETAGAV